MATERPTPHAYQRACLFGDSDGLARLIAQLPPDVISCLVGASIRPLDQANVARLAGDLDVPCLFQPKPAEAGYPAFLAHIRAASPDLIVCNSYSMILRPEVLDVVAWNAVNVHAALLPRNRGPNPLQWAIIKGEPVTGLTLHYMNERVDAGDIIAQTPIPIHDDDTWLTLRSRLSRAFDRLLAAQMPLILAGRSERRPQDETMATANHRLNADSPAIDFTRMNDRQVYDLIRAQVSPLAGAYLDTPQGRRHFPEMLSMAAIAELRAQYG